MRVKERVQPLSGSLPYMQLICPDMQLMQCLKNYFSTSNRFLKMSQKINYPAADRNKSPILEVLQKYFVANTHGNVLEISSGTGQHSTYFASHFPNLTFQPSELDTSLFNSIKAYAEDAPAKNVKHPVSIDVLNDWEKWNVPRDFDYVININMIHVTPFACSEALFRNASGVLKSGGLLITYGPYANNGILEPESNRNFDKSIRSRDANCGIRDIQVLIKSAEVYDMKLINIHELPANNKCLIWQRI